MSDVFPAIRERVCMFSSSDLEVMLEVDGKLIPMDIESVSHDRGGKESTYRVIVKLKNFKHNA
jgi:hypothetical protein